MDGWVNTPSALLPTPREQPVPIPNKQSPTRDEDVLLNASPEDLDGPSPPRCTIRITQRA